MFPEGREDLLSLMVLKHFPLISLEPTSLCFPTPPAPPPLAPNHPPSLGPELGSGVQIALDKEYRFFKFSSYAPASGQV